MPPSDKETAEVHGAHPLRVFDGDKAPASMQPTWCLSSRMMLAGRIRLAKPKRRS